MCNWAKYYIILFCLFNNYRLSRYINRCFNTTSTMRDNGRLKKEGGIISKHIIGSTITIIALNYVLLL